MKKQYTEPKIEIIVFPEEDVIRTSGGFFDANPPAETPDGRGHDTPIVNI